MCRVLQVAAICQRQNVVTPTSHFREVSRISSLTGTLMESLRFAGSSRIFKIWQDLKGILKIWQDLKGIFKIWEDQSFRFGRNL